MPRSRPILELGCALAALLLLPSQALGQTTGSEPLLLEVYVNGIDTQKVGEFERRDGRLWAKPTELSELGLSPPAGSGDAEIAVDSIPGVVVAFDEHDQSVRLSVPVDGLAAHVIGTRAKPAGRTDAAPLGALLNYDVTATTVGHRVDVYGLGSARVFGSFGTVQSDATIARSISGTRIIRLDTTYSRSDPDRLRTWAVGDVISGALPYSRSIRLGGAQVATNFALRPDLVTYPLPIVSGGAAVPSTVDVLVNGVRQLSQPVAAGPFFVPQLPVVTGAGSVSVAVRDAAGRQTIQTSSFYTSAALLAPGLQAVSFELGAVRRNFGVENADYGTLAASATGRRGISSRTTIEAHGEIAGDLIMASGGGTFQLGKFAVATVATGGSTSRFGTGAQLYAAFERTTPRYHVGASVLVASRRFADIGALARDPPPSRIVQANAGFLFGRQGSLGFALTDAKQRAVTGPAGAPPHFLTSDFSLRPAIRTTFATATYSRELFGRAYAYVTGYRDLRSHTGAIMAGISFRFGRSGSVSGGYESATKRATLEASRPAVDPGDVGWRVYAADGADSRLVAESRYRSSRGEIGVGVDRFGGSTYFQVNARGGLVAIGGTIAATNSVTDGFALVDTHGLSGVPVSLNNRPVGKTGRGGKLVVPGLVAYQKNLLALDPSNLPMNASWSSLETIVTPGDRSGAVARFGLKLNRPLLLTIRTTDGQPLPVGSRLTAAGSATLLIVGFDGQAYLSDVSGTQQFEALTPDGQRCAFSAGPMPGKSSVEVVCRPTPVVKVAQAGSLPR